MTAQELLNATSGRLTLTTLLNAIRGANMNWRSDEKLADALIVAVSALAMYGPCDMADGCPVALGAGNDSFVSPTACDEFLAQFDRGRVVALLNARD